MRTVSGQAQPTRFAPTSCYRDGVGLFATIFHELDAASAGYVVVGGVAVVLHGYARATADEDILAVEHIRSGKGHG